MVSAPSPLNIGRCRSCGAPVLWVATVSGRKMPLDCPPVWVLVGEPVDVGPGEGLLHLFTASGLQASGRVVDGPRPGASHPLDGTLVAGAYTQAAASHFATCPHANQWRRPSPG